jgi:hypothetical protein
VKKTVALSALFSGQWLIVKLTAGCTSLLGQFITICSTTSMKRFALVVALLTTAAAPVMAEPLHLFSITTADPQNIDFKGTGTANFNNSTGTANNFNVGSSTNLGVNGSINATRDYSGTSDGTLQLAGTSVMQQTIGTSGNAANVQAASQAAGLAAFTSANQFAKEQAEDAALSSYGSSYVDGTVYQDVDGNTVAVANTEQWEAAKESFYQATFNTKYQERYAADYQTTLGASQLVESSSSSSSSANTQNGVISGDFKTTNSGASGSTSSHKDWLEDARDAADALYGSSYTDMAANGSATAAQKAAITTEAEWRTAWDAAYDSSYDDSQSAQWNESESLVTVTGVGNIANVNAAGSSSFTVRLTPRDIPTYSEQVTALAGGNVTAQPIIFPDENGSASGSSGANLATSSYANQSNNQSASAFIQAFAASNTTDATTAD